MDETISSNPNDTVVIEYEVIDLENNTVLLKAKGVLLGKINSSGVFKSEKGNKTLIGFSDKEAIKTKKVFAFATTIDALKEEFNDDNIDNLLISYYSKINKDLIFGIKENGRISSIVSKSYHEVSPEITGDLYKQRGVQETPAPALTPAPQVMKKTGQNGTIDNFALENYLKERIFNNDDLIEDVVTTIVNNYEATDAEDIEAILAIGPTGSGKTRTFELISEYIGLPITIYDCNSLTSAGYVGKDIDDILLCAYNNSDKNIEVAERSIVVLDEIDKLAAKGLDVKDSSVQHALLKFLDGYKYSVAPSRNAKPIDIDTSFMSIVGLGAFPDLYAAKTQKKSKSTIGFGSDLKAKDESRDEERLNVEEIDDDIVAYGGLIPELVGRFPNKVAYIKLSKDDIYRIIFESKDSMFLRKINKYLRRYNTTVDYGDSFKDALVEAAYAKNVGGRSIKETVAKTFKKVDRELIRLEHENPGKPKVLKLTAETVKNNHHFEF